MGKIPAEHKDNTKRLLDRMRHEIDLIRNKVNKHEKAIGTWPIGIDPTPGNSSSRSW